ncbi:hypothetical protein TRVL_03931 [Trypanosoma vivax]|nr:hypothetical protein TRVL_03931 [Trypanosoma vivax]
MACLFLVYFVLRCLLFFVLRAGLVSMSFVARHHGLARSFGISSHSWHVLFKVTLLPCAVVVCSLLAVVSLAMRVSKDARSLLVCFANFCSGSFSIGAERAFLAYLCVSVFHGHARR